MKNILNRMLAVPVILMIALSGTAFAEKNPELYEKYGYKERFQYNDEMIEYALRAAVPQIRMSYSAVVRYEPVAFDEDYIFGLFLNVREKLGEAATAEKIIGTMLEHTKESIRDYLTFDVERTTGIRGVFTCGGVVIGEDGYIATNSHMVNLDEITKKELYYYGLSGNVEREIEYLAEKFGEYGVALSESKRNDFYNLIFRVVSENFEIVRDDVELDVCFPTGNGSEEEPGVKTYRAEIAASGAAQGNDVLTKDTAILKIDAENLVALKLSEDYPALNSKVVSAGFPAEGNGSFRGLGVRDMETELAADSGVVLRMNPIEGAKYQTIGVTDVATGRNSGAPSVDTWLDVEGLNTYVNTGDGRYGFMIPAELVKVLASAFDIGQGSVSKTFMTGLQLLQNGYGSAALECFSSVAAGQPDTPYIDNLIALAKKSPGREYTAPGEESDFTELIAAAAIAAVLLAAVAGVVSAGRRDKRRKKKKVSLSDTVPLYTAEGKKSAGRPVGCDNSEGTVPLAEYEPPESQECAVKK